MIIKHLQILPKIQKILKVIFYNKIKLKKMTKIIFYKLQSVLDYC